jgi:hypothetical protein
MTRLIVDLNESDLLAKLKNFEDHFVERKVAKDDMSCRPGCPTP